LARCDIGNAIILAVSILAKAQILLTKEHEKSHTYRAAALLIAVIKTKI
jgi:hypothetical protein